MVSNKMEDLGDKEYNKLFGKRIKASNVLKGGITLLSEH